MLLMYFTNLSSEFLIRTQNFDNLNSLLTMFGSQKVLKLTVVKKITTNVNLISSNLKVYENVQKCCHEEQEDYLQMGWIILFWLRGLGYSRVFFKWEGCDWLTRSFSFSEEAGRVSSNRRWLEGKYLFSPATLILPG